MKSRVKDPDKRAEPRPCKVCGEAFSPHRSRKTAKFCSPHCMWVEFKGPEYNAKISRESKSARGDALRDRGEGKTYRKRDGRHEHRTIAERKIGRALQPGEIVHHADENKRNNNPGNLEVLPNQSEHARIHGFGRFTR